MLDTCADDGDVGYIVRPGVSESQLRGRRCGSVSRAGLHRLEAVLRRLWRLSPLRRFRFVYILGASEAASFAANSRLASSANSTVR